MGLVEHAQTELTRAGLFDADSDYGGAIGTAVLALATLFAEQGHSGGSATLTLATFAKVAAFQPLTSITSDPAEWVQVASTSGPTGELWQNNRKSSCFSTDGGQTHYDIEAGDEQTIRVTPSP